MTTIGKPTTIKALHCSSCGLTKAEGLGTHEGYTFCCNKPTCIGAAALDRFGTPDINVRACCWGAADTEYARLNVPVPATAWMLEVGA